MHTAVATAPLLENSLISKQIELETDAIAAGVRRYNDNVAASISRNEGASLKPVERLLLHWYKPMRLAIRAKQGRMRRGENELFSAMALSLKADDLAVITMHEVLSQCVKFPDGVNMRHLAYSVGAAVDAEINLRKLKDNDSDDAKKLLNSARRMTPQRVNAWARHKLTEYATNKAMRTAIGKWLVWEMVALASAAPYGEDFVHALKIVGPKKLKRLVLTERTWEIISSGHNVRSVMRPRHLPMVIPPLPWVQDGQVPGGYQSYHGPFISKPTPEQNEALKAADKTRIYECLTASSAAGWRRNLNVLKVQRAVWDQGGGELGLPSADDAPMPPLPSDFTTNRESKKLWKRAAAEIHSANRSRKADRVNFLNKLTVAEQFAAYDAIYFPHQLCFRGRSYPIPLYLNHQGDDVCRGLLEIAEPKMVATEEAKRWVRIHAANCYGFDKLPFDQRDEWCRQAERNIKAVVADPLDTIGWWGEADKPWQFLAACYAVCDPAAAAHLPIQQDGVCNGLQQYAAMLRDPRAAAAVSMVASDRPGDVYTEVAVATQARVAADSLGGNAIASSLVDHVDRGVVKQTVMTTVYGVTMVGAREQLRERLKEKGFEGQALHDASNYLQKVVFDSIGNVCQSAKDAMLWIRECAGIIAKAGHAVRWDTPLGFPVVQPYRRSRMIRVRSGGKRVKINVESGPVRVSRQRQAAAPNFVHSIDSTHMFLTARQMALDGLWFAAVHDSFWTHAASTDAMHAILRAKFVDLHDKPLLTDLRDQWHRRYGLDLPDAPPVGDFDIRSVLTSPYFFS